MNPTESVFVEELYFGTTLYIILLIVRSLPIGLKFYHGVKDKCVVVVG